MDPSDHFSGAEGQVGLVLSMYALPNARPVQPIAASKRNDNFLIEDETTSPSGSTRSRA